MNVRALFASAALCGALLACCGQAEAQFIFGYAGGATFKGEVGYYDYGCGGYGGCGYGECGGYGCGKHGGGAGRGTWIHGGSRGGCSSGGCSSCGNGGCGIGGSGRGFGRHRGCNGGCDSGCNGGCDYAPSEGGIDLSPEKKLEPTPAESAPEAPVPPSEPTARRTGIIRPVSLDRATDASFAAGWLAYRNGQHELAIETLSAVVSAEPHNAAAAYGLALAHFDLGNRDVADAALAHAVAVEVEHPVAGFGKLMERVQGSRRVWLEAARR